MGKRKEISSYNRAAIIALHNEGFSIRSIAEKGSASKSAVGDIIKKYRDNGTGNPLKSPGRRTKRRLSSKALAQDLQESSNVNISARSVRRRLLKADLKCHRPAKKPFINTQQRERRVRWCLEHREWILDQWRKVIFTMNRNFNSSIPKELFDVVLEKSSIRNVSPRQLNFLIP